MQILQDTYFAQRDEVIRFSKGREIMAEAASKEKTPKTKAKKNSFFKGLKIEFNKIIWPDRETVGKQTAAVVACSIALGLIIALLDLIIKFGLSFIL